MTMNYLAPSFTEGNIIQDRRALEQFVELAIEILNRMDGDPDLEPTEDFEGASDEDEFSTGFKYHGRDVSGAGCLVSDDDTGGDDRRPIYADAVGRAERARRRHRMGLHDDRNQWWR